MSTNLLQPEQNNTAKSEAMVRRCATRRLKSETSREENTPQPLRRRMRKRLRESNWRKELAHFICSQEEKEDQDKGM
jgi:hypothetical protein